MQKSSNLPDARNGPFVVIRDKSAPLYIPHRSRNVAPDMWSDYPLSIPDHWHDLARAKGFRIDRRVRDRGHLALQCLTCGAHTAVKIAALRTSAVRCGGCAAQLRDANAQDADLVFLRRDENDHHYGVFRAACGHEVRRQFALIERVRAGETGIRCGACLVAREEAEARANGWERLGADPKGNPSYRLYRHKCGHKQRIARANMRHGQCDCSRCGESWSSKPSTIYLARIVLPEVGLEVLKFGYSANPKLRFKHQLGLSKSARVTMLRLLDMPTGHLACSEEKAANARLARDYPDSVVPHSLYADLINVCSEIYTLDLLLRIEQEMDHIAARIPTR
ncbi:hypothetical protein [Roseinatronobacter bogoriensis]|uniref:hypothetical protein n=1 Tax=Roseinatronobacter bogoriensis TaxID=119542 RepID=UPI000A04EC12|nr:MULTISPECIES: hypothetical protein [Rhodobaca]MBB4209404.1 hypothetical protein [Rhodobaca bogoriensis DSM 18756]TDW34537.1 hypothetical protein LY39_03319 [Rhodobaca barguzinensis]TDY67145.1 hypothetical protein EV660_108148 [Rhodobaca bogoriensis DSM 18756]